MNCAQHETNVDEPARPRAMVSVGNRRAHVDCARRVLHGIVEKRKLTGHRISPIRQTHFSLERALAHLFLHPRQVVLRNREISIDWINSLDYQKRITVAGSTAGRTACSTAGTARVDDVANVRQTLSRTAVDRRANIAIA